MNRYLVIAPHTVEDCAKSIEQVEATGYITHFDWGCKDGVHKSWIVVDVDSKDEAWNIVPPLYRPRATIIQLNAFTMADIEDLVRHHKP